MVLFDFEDRRIHKNVKGTQVEIWQLVFILQLSAILNYHILKRIYVTFLEKRYIMSFLCVVTFYEYPDK